MGNPGFMEKKYQILALSIAILLLLLGIMLYFKFADPSRFWSCSPTEPRGNDSEAWQKTNNPAQPAKEMDEDFFENFTISSDSDYYRVKHPSGNHPINAFTFELNKMSPDKPLDIGGGTLQFSCIGTAYHDANQTMSDDAVFRFYDPQLQPVNVANMVEPSNYATAESGSNFRYSPWPAVQFIFQHRGIENLIFHGIKIFDCHTHEFLTTGYNSSGRESTFRFNTHIPLWHRTPVDVVIDISYGPVKTFEFAPRVGEGFVEGSFQCRLLAVFEGINAGSSSYTTRDNMETVEIPKAPPDKAGLCFLFVCWPTASQIPVTFDFLDKDGNKLSTCGSSTSGYTTNTGLKESLEKVALIRACYRTRRRRIVVQLPYIPGLPKENNLVKNLFDVYIPYVMLHDPDQVEQFLRRTLQLSRSRSTGRVASNSINSDAFPMEFKKATISEIAKCYAQGGSLSIDIENDRLIREYPEPLWIRFRKFLQKVFQ
jgi:hypothetical protein